MTIFAKILRGEIPCHRVYEDAHVLSFLDIHPLSHGHTLVIPKEAAATLDQLSEEAAAALGLALPRIARALIIATGACNYNVLQNNGEAAGQTIPHVHFHIVPKHLEGTGGGFVPGKLDNTVGALLSQAIGSWFEMGSPSRVHGFAPGVDLATKTFTCPRCGARRDCQALNPICLACRYSDPRSFVLD